MVSGKLHKFVWERAKSICEYCRLPQELHPGPFQIDHIIAVKHKGQSVEENLALSCYRCNLHKGPNVAGIDPENKELTPLYNPRKDLWEDHFYWDREFLIGKTAIGRVTIDVLTINDPISVAMRLVLIEEGVFP